MSGCDHRGPFYSMIQEIKDFLKQHFKIVYGPREMKYFPVLKIVKNNDVISVSQRKRKFTLDLIFDLIGWSQIH